MNLNDTCTCGEEAAGERAGERGERRGGRSVLARGVDLGDRAAPAAAVGAAPLGAERSHRVIEHGAGGPSVDP